MGISGINSLSVDPMMFILQIINLIILLFLLGISIYLIFLAIKALRIYIKKNS